MDAVSFSYADKQAKRIKKIIADPDSTSGVVTVPKTIASGENITIPSGRVAVLPNVQIDGTLNVQGDVFIPSGATLSGVVEKVTSTDNALVRFNGTTGDVQNSLVTVSDIGSITFPSGARITGDFTNGTLANRVMFQSSVTNGGTALDIIPNGTSNYSGLGLFTDSSLTNGSYLEINISSTEARLNSSRLTASGTYQPMTFYTGGSERMRIDSSGNVGIGTSSPSTLLHLQAATQAVHRLTSGTATTDLLTTQDSNGMLRTVGAHPLVFATQNIERFRIDATGNALVTNSTGGLGYGTGSGGTVAQLTSKSTAVTLNKPTGNIIMSNAALAANASAAFTFNNSLIGAYDNVSLFINYGGNYSARATTTGAGSCVIYVKNETGGSLSEAVQVTYTIIKGANS